MNALLSLEFSHSHVLTTRPEFRPLHYEHRGSMVHLHLWDTAGEERFRSVTRRYFRNSQIALLCYDITSQDTFDHVDDWAALVRDEAADARILLVGTKKDLETTIRVPLSLVAAKARECGYEFVETSSLTREGVAHLRALMAESAPAGVPAPVSALSIGADFAFHSWAPRRCC
jgi:small GTP-binding protein